MEKHLIALDLDGTLMLDFSHYDLETINYLKKLIDLGHIVIIATGRPLRSSYFVYKALGLTTPIINYNGALVTNPTDKNYPITDFRVKLSELKDILEFSKEGLINAFAEIYDTIYVNEYNDKIHDFLHVDGGTLIEGSISETLPDDPHGCLMFVTNDMVEKLQHYVAKKYYQTLRSRYWSIGNYNIVEIYNISVNKGSGIKDAISYYKIDPKNTIAIGDGHNDIEMFQNVNTRVAMANAHPDLLPYATTTTSKFDEQGVLKFLRTYFE